MQKKNRTLRKIAAFIIDKKILFFILFVAALVGSFFTAGLTVVDNDLYHFLPEKTETRRALDAMGSEFFTYATAQVMVDNISLNDAFELSAKLGNASGVKSVKFAFDEEHYRGKAALFDVTFKGDLSAEISKDGVSQIEHILESYPESYLATDVGLDYTKTIVKNMAIVGAIAVAIVIVMLFVTSRSYAEVPVFLIVFATAALLQVGTNFVFDSISYISNAVTLVLQLALAIDYSVILCNRYAEEHLTAKPREAMIAALSKAIPEISASSLTTIGGLIAMSFIQFGLGKDLAVVLIKSILISMLTVFLLMPGLLMLFAKAIDRSRHRSFVPKISGVGRFAWRSRRVIPPLFILLIIVALHFSSSVEYRYDYESLMPINKREGQVAECVIHETFGYNNMMALVVPSGDYEVEAAMLEEIDADPHVTSTMGLATVDVAEGRRLGDHITLDEFAELAGLDDMSATALFAYYAARHSDYDAEDMHSYKVPLVDLFLFLYDISESGKLELAAEQKQMIADYYDQLSDAKLQLKGQKYSRMLIYSDYPVESEESYALIETIRNIAESYYDGADIFVAGNTTCARDVRDSFKHDNVLNTVLSALFVVIVIIFTFRNVGLSLLLIIVIQGSIWLNFSVPYFTGGDVFFLSYLIVGAIQMGANIDYAIVVSNRYITLREQDYSRKKAITEAVNGALPTLLTSGSILAFAGLLIGFLVSEAVSANIGIALGRGTFISLLLVLFILPQILLWGDKFILKTSFRDKSLNVNVPKRFRDDFEAVARGEQVQSEKEAAVDPEPEAEKPAEPEKPKEVEKERKPKPEKPKKTEQQEKPEKPKKPKRFADDFEAVAQNKRDGKAGRSSKGKDFEALGQSNQKAEQSRRKRIKGEDFEALAKKKIK